jgi:KipI family sensor histidine kinase inhibitor
MDAIDRWRWVGDRALLREFLDGDLATANQAARAVHRSLLEHRGAEIEDVIPGARSVLILLRPGQALSESVLRDAERNAGREVAGRATTHEIAVRYGGEDGPDLAELARLHGLSASEVVTIHNATVYTVGFLGFSPGFPYLLGLSPRIATPRLATPRTRVPAGSVAIGGEFTGVYPQAMPGGWRLIGRTDLALFDSAADPPARLAPGDRVRFVPR